MAAKDDTSKARPGRHSASAKQQASAPKTAGAAKNRVLEDVVEDERLRLMRAHSILCCVATGMEDENICTGDGPYWPAVIESARDLIDESIRNLESTQYSPKPPRSTDEVRERAAEYLCGASRRRAFFTHDAGSGSRVEAIDFLHGSSYREVGQANIAATFAP